MPTPVTQKNTTGKSRLLSGAPILIVSSITKAADYYHDRLGFQYELYNDPPDFCILGRDGANLMLSQATGPDQITPHWKHVSKLWNIYYWVNDAAALYAEYQQTGAIIDYELYEKPYGCLEFGIQDLDGYDIAFGQEL